MKKLTKIEKELATMIYKQPVSLDGNEKNVRARIKKSIKEFGVSSAKELYILLKKQIKVKEKRALAVFMQSEKYKEIMKLPPFVRYYEIPEDIWDKEGFEFIKIPESYKEKYKKLCKSAPAYIENVVKEASYYACDFGKKRKTYEGINDFHCDTHGSDYRYDDNGKYGMKKVVWYYADYFVCLNADKTKAFYKLCNGETGTFAVTKNGNFKFKNKNYRRPHIINTEKVIKAHHFRAKAKRIMSEIAGIHFEWDRKDNSPMFVDSANGELYHFYADVNSYKSMKSIYRYAVQAFIKRRKQIKEREQFEKLEKFVNEHKEQIFVSVCDSINAGNCKFGTKQFVAQGLQIDNTKIGAVTAGLILEMRNDLYAMRACVEAAKRFIKVNSIAI